MRSGSHGVRRTGVRRPLRASRWPRRWGAVCRQVGQVAEKLFEADWADHFDHSGRRGARVPHGVQFASRLCDVAARAEHGLAVA